ncbi:probable E3 ubiquitin-protein ligase XBOS36 isoform X2 [Portunus trituberculatus]|nr:probable E3 ubiquitin-protein ligase XBOS36 isoform X2 [Portunus trituberculatus]
MTPLMLAASNGYPKAVKTLLTFGANPLATNSDGVRALHLAAAEGHHECVAALIDVTPPTPTHPEGITSVHVASYNGHVEVLEQLTDAGWSLTGKDNDGWTPLHFAAVGGCVASAQWLVQRGADPGVQDRNGHTPLNIAEQYGCHEVETWLAKNFGGTVKSEDRRVDQVVRLWSRVLLIGFSGMWGEGQEGSIQRGGMRGRS